MPFEKNNTLGEGRPKNATNKLTQEIRENFQRLISKNMEQLEADLKEMEGKDRVRMIIELSKFVLPTLKSTELKGEGSDSLVVKIGYGDEMDKHLKGHAS